MHRLPRIGQPPERSRLGFGAFRRARAERIEGAAELLLRVPGKNPATTMVVIDEASRDNGATGGDSIAVLRAESGK